jgi:DNA-binding NarL/FixJ family response regulator
VARGLSDQQIAEQLSISKWTVRDYLRSLFAKSGASSRTELLHVAYSRDWLAPDLHKDL